MTVNEEVCNHAIRCILNLFSTLFNKLQSLISQTNIYNTRENYYAFETINLSNCANKHTEPVIKLTF